MAGESLIQLRDALGRYGLRARLKKNVNVCKLRVRQSLGSIRRHLSCGLADVGDEP